MIGRRIAQLLIWLAAGPLLGLLQGAVSFVPVVVTRPPRADDWHDISVLLLGGLFYGLCWLTAAMLAVDLLFLRRSLPARELARFIGIIAAVAAAIGILTPGYLVMIGVPVTALGVLVVGFVLRRRSDDAGVTSDSSNRT